MPSALAADRARIAELEAQILDLERSLAALQLEKTVTQERIDSYRYPVLTLPAEITSEIFIHFLPIYPLCPPLSGPLSPTLLTRICCQWRYIALATPALWRAITVSGNVIPCDYISTILGRSGCCPISIQIGNEESLYTNADDPGSAVLAAVISHRDRWESLTVCLSHSSFPPIGAGMPLLRRLDLAFSNDLNEHLVFQEVPLLRTVILDVVASFNVVLPWTQLTSLTIHDASLFNCVPTLQQVTNLIHCELVLCDSEDEDVLPDISLPYLESLCWNDHDNNDPLPDCLHIFVVPALRSLKVTETLLQPDPINFLSSFVSKSGCKLQEVHIRGARTVSQQSYRSAFPSIRKFIFDDLHCADHSDGSDASDAETE
ncbi:F-box domain-containing protein [Mycena venus]|uniref:F-box domain-containing protein n=1 Tax=Mycena venus TaxID=2733690 RepID=A0A8H7CEM9_9AGAR|nr:F-box domain-containing protein [Mycena venus]